MNLDEMKGAEEDNSDLFEVGPNANYLNKMMKNFKIGLFEVYFYLLKDHEKSLSSVFICSLIQFC